MFSSHVWLPVGIRLKRGPTIVERWEVVKTQISPTSMAIWHLEDAAVQLQMSWMGTVGTNLRPTPTSILTFRRWVGICHMVDGISEWSHMAIGNQGSHGCSWLHQWSHSGFCWPYTSWFWKCKTLSWHFMTFQGGTRVHFHKPFRCLMVSLRWCLGVRWNHTPAIPAIPAIPATTRGVAGAIYNAPTRACLQLCSVSVARPTTNPDGSGRVQLPSYTKHQMFRDWGQTFWQMCKIVLQYFPQSWTPKIPVWWEHVW